MKKHLMRDLFLVVAAVAAWIELSLLDFFWEIVLHAPSGAARWQTLLVVGWLLLAGAAIAVLGWAIWQRCFGRRGEGR